MYKSKRMRWNNMIYVIPMIISLILAGCTSKSSSSTSTSSDSKTTISVNASVSGGTLSASSFGASQVGSTEPLPNAFFKVFNKVTLKEYTCIQDITENENKLTDSEGNVDITITDSCISKESKQILKFVFIKMMAEILLVLARM